MRVLSIIALLFCLSIPAFAQDQSVPSGEVAQTTTVTTTVHTAKLTRDGDPKKPKSIAVSQTSTSVGILWLNDGFKNATAFTTPPLFAVHSGNKWVDSNVSIVGFGAFTIGGSTQIWGGTALKVDVIKSASGLGLSLYGGVKAGGSKVLVFGAGASIPFSLGKL